MTGRQKKQALLLAVENLLSDGDDEMFGGFAYSPYSCDHIMNAIDELKFPDTYHSGKQLVDEYCSFYCKEPGGYWLGRAREFRFSRQRSNRLRNHRAILLLWFREVGMEGIGL